MRAPLLVLTLSIAPAAALAQGQAKAQVQRLVDSIEAPIAYLCLEAMPAGTGSGSAGGDARQPGPVQKLLADPSLDALFRPGTGADATGSAKALALVRGVLARSSGELELVLTGIVPNGGQPLLVLRARLQRREADSLQMALDEKQLATPARRLGGNTVYHLDSAVKATGPGQDVELALVGTDLVVGNDSTALREVLEPAPAGTATANTSKVLSADARFVAMRQRLPVSPGALWLYGDWQRLGNRIEGSLGGLPGALMGSSGLGSARAVMASIASEKGDFTATLLLDFNAPVAPATPRGARPGPDGGDAGIDGWFAAVEPIAARALLAELPAGGLGGLVLSVDLAGVASRSHEGWHLLRDLERAFDEFHGTHGGFQRSVLSRLGKRGTVQLLVDKGPGGAELGAIYTIRTKNKKAAADLFDDLRRACERARLATPLAVEVKDGGRERRTVDLLELRHNSPRGVITMFLAANEDSLLMSADSDTLVAVVDELRHPGKPRPRRELSAAAISAIGGENVAGLFDVDLQPLFEQLAAAVAGAGGGALDLSALPKRHVGYLDLQKHATGTVVRMRLLSSR